MKKILLPCFLSIFSLFIISCNSTAVEESSTENSCVNELVQITADFSTGRMDDCELVENNQYVITLSPENRPINPSPWYAFKIQAKQNTPISIAMKVRGAKSHRYPPKVSQDGKTWQLQDYRLEGKMLKMDLVASAKPMYIAAQEIINNEYYDDWAAKVTANGILKRTLLGNSTEGRPIYKLESRQADNKEWLVILGRQHPPEITGALALFPFVETLISGSEMSKQYLQKYNILVIPNINPDGVHAGNWRHNANGLDLNRDWNKFSQVETRIINDYLQGLVAQGDKITFAIDFHSTKRDIFYSMPVHYGVEKPYFVRHWLGHLDEQMPDFEVKIKPGNNPGLGVSKQYFSDQFGVHAITYEMGDNTNRDEIKRIAYNAANSLMFNMLADIDHSQE